MVHGMFNVMFQNLPYFWNIVCNLHSMNFFLLILYFLLLPHNHILMRAKKSELYCKIYLIARFMCNEKSPIKVMSFFSDAFHVIIC